MLKNTILLILVALFGLQFSGGFMSVERQAPTAICKALTPSYGDPQGGCSHAGGVLIRFSISKNS
jgi:hypothetical protein